MTESAKWRKFLHPVVAGLALFLTAAVAAIQKNESTESDARITAIEIKTGNVSDRVDEFKVQYDKNIATMMETLSNVRSDVAFIRGKMEGQAQRKW